MLCRRGLVFLLACLALATGARAQDFRVTLLGTGSPLPISDRFGAATLVEAGQEKLLFYVGRGGTKRLTQIGGSIGALNAVFLTHLHFGHTSRLPHLLRPGWIFPSYPNPPRTIP